MKLQIIAQDAEEEGGGGPNADTATQLDSTVSPNSHQMADMLIICMQEVTEGMQMVIGVRQSTCSP